MTTCTEGRYNYYLYGRSKGAGTSTIIVTSQSTPLAGFVGIVAPSFDNGVP